MLDDIELRLCRISLQSGRFWPTSVWANVTLVTLKSCVTKCDKDQALRNLSFWKKGRGPHCSYAEFLRRNNASGTGEIFMRLLFLHTMSGLCGHRVLGRANLTQLQEL
jgi:hypothetical protein